MQQSSAISPHIEGVDSTNGVVVVVVIEVVLVVAVVALHSGTRWTQQLPQRTRTKPTGGLVQALVSSHRAQAI
jgi:hypothetical protein